MKTINLFFTILVSNFMIAQNFAREKTEIENVIRQIKESIVQKDSATFYGLFHENPVVWIGLIKNKSQQKRLQLNPSIKKNYFKSTFEKFFHNIRDEGQKEERFENIKITNDDVIASITFEYSFWNENKMTNWGNEYWHLIKIEDKWKIVSVIYSIEISEFFPKIIEK